MTDLVMRVNKCNMFEAMRFIDAYKTDEELDPHLFETDEPSSIETSMIVSLNNMALDSAEAKEYFDYRGITEESMREFLLGYSPKLGMVTVPVKNEDGSFAGFVGRKASRTEKEFKNSGGFKRKFCLFNLDNCLDSTHVFVVDATFDAIRLHQLGFPAVATMGGLTTDQAMMLGKYFGTIYVVADNEGGVPDLTSERNFSKAKSVSRRSVSMVRLPSNYKDVGVMPDDEIRELLNKVIEEWR
jgi:DNA primase